MYKKPWRQMPCNKYKSNKANRGDKVFASKAEASLYDILFLMEKSGKISEIECQASVRLSAACIEYRPDFKFVDNESGETVWAEFKGVETPVWRIKRRLWKHYGPGKLQVYKGNVKSIYLKEEIIPKNIENVIGD